MPSALIIALALCLSGCGGKDDKDKSQVEKPKTKEVDADSGLTKRDPPKGVVVRFRTPDTLSLVVVQAFRNQDVMAFKQTFPSIADIYLAYYEAGYDDARIEQELGDINQAYPSIVETYAQSFKAAIQNAQKAGVDFKSIQFQSVSGEDAVVKGLSYKKPLTIKCKHAKGAFVLEIEKSLHGPSGWFGSRIRFKAATAS